VSERGEFKFGDTIITYSVIRSSRRRKTIEVTVDPNEGVLVAAPVDTRVERIQELVARRAGWIIRQTSIDLPRPRRRELVSGESLPYLGRQARLFVERARVRQASVTFDHWALHVVAPFVADDEERRALVQRAVTRWYRARAVERLPPRAEHWSSLAGYGPARILIRDQRERWGSCGLDGTLRFNWRIVMAPPSLIDYVIVHELAHLRVRTHSPAFWAEVSRLIPDYLIRRARLKEIGSTLTL